MIKNLVFDVGMVLVDFVPYPVLKKMGYSDEVSERICKATVRNPVWKEYDRGVWSTEQVHDAMVQADPLLEKEIRYFLAHMDDTIVERPAIVPWFCELKQEGYKLYFLSNYPHLLYEQTRKHMPFLPVVDGGIFSYREKMIKPDPAIYRCLTERYDLKAEECLFFDDRQENVDGALRVGMKAELFTNIEKMQATVALL